MKQRLQAFVDKLQTDIIMLRSHRWQIRFSPP